MRRNTNENCRSDHTYTSLTDEKEIDLDSREKTNLTKIEALTDAKRMIPRIHWHSTFASVGVVASAVLFHFQTSSFTGDSVMNCCSGIVKFTASYSRGVPFPVLFYSVFGI